MINQYMTFYLNGQFFGIDVMEVQEVTKEMDITPVRLSLPFVSGLINLRGKIATAIDLGILFSLTNESKEEFKTVVCDVDDVLYAFIVDRIGDVVSIDDSEKRSVPANTSETIKNYIDHVYDTDTQILSILKAKDIISEFQNNKKENLWMSHAN